jgi:hypothetical protein
MPGYRGKMPLPHVFWLIASAKWCAIIVGVASSHELFASLSNSYNFKKKKMTIRATSWQLCWK